MTPPDGVHGVPSTLVCELLRPAGKTDRQDEAEALLADEQARRVIVDMVPTEAGLLRVSTEHLVLGHAHRDGEGR